MTARRPENAVGWLMLGTGVLLSLAILLGQYAGYALLRDPSLPLGKEAAWVTSWMYDPVFCGVILMFLLFPLGHADGPVRTWTVRVCVAAGLLETLGQMVLPEPMDGFGDVMNPFAVPSLACLARLVSTAPERCSRAPSRSHWSRSSCACAGPAATRDSSSSGSPTRWCC